MGFPEWTLWGMGLSMVGALVAITLSWIGQSPRMARRLGMAGARLDLRVRVLTGYALALLLLTIAFFLAGVPLGATTEPEALALQDSLPEGESDALTAASASESNNATETVATPATPETGAFSGPPVSRPASAAPDLSGPNIDSLEAPAFASPEATGSATPTTGRADAQPSPTSTVRPTETATPAPTETPFPTLTPTTISGETAVVSTNGSTLWLKRSPGGQNLVLVRDGDVVLVRPSRANQGGILWREVTTVSGVEGWLQDQFLLYPEQESTG